MQEEKTACSFEQTPGGWLPKGKELGSQVWPWISPETTDQRYHRDSRALSLLIIRVCHQPAWQGERRPWEREPTEARTGQAPDLDGFETSSPAILLLFSSDMLVCFIKENSRKDMRKPKPYGKSPWTALIIWSFTKPKSYFPFLKDQIVLNFLQDSAS